MELNSPSEVVAFIRSRSMRVRTGIWLMPPSYLGQERNEAARLQIDAADLRSRLLTSLPEGARFAGLTPDRVLALLDETSQHPGASDCVLVYNVDLLLARLTRTDRKIVWQRLYQSMPYRRRALLVAIPDTAEALLPSADDLAQWGRDKRLTGGRPLFMEGEHAQD